MIGLPFHHSRYSVSMPINNLEDLIWISVMKWKSDLHIITPIMFGNISFSNILGSPFVLILPSTAHLSWIRKKSTTYLKFPVSLNMLQPSETTSQHTMHHLFIWDMVIQIGVFFVSEQRRQLSNDTSSVVHIVSVSYLIHMTWTLNGNFVVQINFRSCFVLLDP